MKIIQNLSASFLILAVTILSTVSIMGIWEIFDKDVIGKSFQTLGLLAIVAIIMMTAGRLIESRSSAQMNIAEPLNPIWKSVRTITLASLIVSVSLLAFLGILSIWEIIQAEDTFAKSLSSLGTLAFGTFIIVMTCLEREGKLDKLHPSYSIGSIVSILVLLIVAYIFFSFFF